MRQFRFLYALVATALCLVARGGAFWMQMGGTPDFDLNRSREAHVTVEYSVQGGIFNQHMDHCQTLMLAVALKAQRLLWPPSQDRDTYKVVYNSQRWHFVEAGEIYDIDSIVSFALEKYGMEVDVLPLDGYRRPTARMKSYVTLWHPSTGSGYGRRVYIEMLIRRGRQDLQAVAQHINEKIEILLEASRSSDEAPSVKVVLDTPFALLASAPRSIARPELHAVAFAPQLNALADQAVAAIQARSGSKLFSGMHLRIEPDAKGMQEWLAGTAAVEALYDEAMTQAGFDSSQPLYVASGLLSLNPEHSGNISRVMENPWFKFCQQRATDVVMKDTLLPQEALQQLGNEHKAVLDFLVLMRATRVVGFLGSTFSQQLRLYRAISDPSPDGSTVMVGDIGQNGLQHTPEVQAIIDAGMQERATRRANSFTGRLSSAWESLSQGMSPWVPLAVLFPVIAVLVLKQAVLRKNGRLSLAPLQRSRSRALGNYSRLKE